MWKLSIEDDQGATTVVQLARAEYTIGRGEENTIRLTERNISRRHARLLRQDGNWVLVDLGSYNGCFVNGVRAGENQLVGPKDLIQLGDYRLEFITDESLSVTRGGGRSDASQSIAPASPYETSQDRLVMVVGPTPGREYPLSSQPLVLGRGEDCDITVNHPSVSRHHAELHHVKDHHYEIIDKKSSNGLRINGVELPRGLIEVHDVIEFGDIVLKLIPSGEVYRPTPEESEKIARMLGVYDDVEILSHSARLKLAWSGMSKGARVSVSILGVLVCAMFVAVVVTGRIHARQKAIQPAPIDSVARLVQAVQSKTAADKLEEAQQLLANIPMSSPTRSVPAFRDVLSRWADAMLEKATSATTNEEKKAIYETLASDRGLDDAHRNRARDSLNLLNERLAAAQALATAPSTLDASVAAATEPDAGISAAAMAKNVAPVPKQALNTRTAVKASSGYTPTAGAQNASSAGRAMAPIIAEKNRLKAKVASGDSTDTERRYLRALCRQLNDSSCSR